MNLAEFRTAVRAAVVDGLAADARVMIDETGESYRRGALTVTVGEHLGRTAVGYDAVPTAQFGHSSGTSLSIPLAAESVGETARVVRAWLDDPYLHRSD